MQNASQSYLYNEKHTSMLIIYALSMHHDHNGISFARPLGLYFDLTYSKDESSRWKYTVWLYLWKSIHLRDESRHPQG